MDIYIVNHARWYDTTPQFTPIGAFTTKSKALTFVRKHMHPLKGRKDWSPKGVIFEVDDDISIQYNLTKLTVDQ